MNSELFLKRQQNLRIGRASIKQNKNVAKLKELQKIHKNQLVQIFMNESSDFSSDKSIKKKADKISKQLKNSLMQINEIK